MIATNTEYLYHRNSQILKLHAILVKMGWKVPCNRENVYLKSILNKHNDMHIK